MLLDLSWKSRLCVHLLPHLLDDLPLLVELLHQTCVFFLEHLMFRVQLLDHATHKLEAVGELLDCLKVFLLFFFSLLVLLFQLYAPLIQYIHFFKNVLSVVLQILNNFLKVLFFFAQLQCLRLHLCDQLISFFSGFYEIQFLRLKSRNMHLLLPDDRFRLFHLAFEGQERVIFI